MASGNRLAYIDPLSNQAPAANFATFDTRAGGSTPAEAVPVLDFDDTTVEYADFKVRLPEHYSGGGLTLSIEWSATSATTGNVVWSAAIRRIENDLEDIDAAFTYDYNNSAATTTASLSGETVKSTITFTNGVDMDSWTAGETAIIRVRRFASDVGDTMTGDAELWNVIIKET